MRALPEGNLKSGGALRKLSPPYPNSEGTVGRGSGGFVVGPEVVLRAASTPVIQNQLFGPNRKREHTTVLQALVESRCDHFLQAMPGHCFRSDCSLFDHFLHTPDDLWHNLFKAVLHQHGQLGHSLFQLIHCEHDGHVRRDSSGAHLSAGTLWPAVHIRLQSCNQMTVSKKRSFEYRVL